MAAAGRVDRDAVPARRVEQGDAGRHPHSLAARQEVQLHPRGLRVLVQAAQLVGGGVRHGAGAGSAAAAACLTLCAAIHPAPHGSRLVSRSAALTAWTSCNDLASMMALVSPLVIAIGRNAAPIEPRSGIPNDTFDAPSVMFTPSSSRSSSMVSSVRSTSEVSAPTGMASGSITMSSIAMPYFPV